MTPIREYFSSTQVLHRLRSMSELVPRSLRGNPAERGQPHRRIRVSSVSIDRGRHDGLHAAHRQGLRWAAKNSALLTGGVIPPSLDYLLMCAVEEKVESQKLIYGGHKQGHKHTEQYLNQQHCSCSFIISNGEKH